MLYRRSSLSLSFVLILALTVPAAAQTGDIKGQVQDAQGQPLAGIAVTLLHAGGKDTQEKTSDAQGNFHFGNLNRGVYVVSVSSEAYAPVTCPGARIIGSLTRNFVLKLIPAEGEQASSCTAAAEGS